MIPNSADINKMRTEKAHRTSAPNKHPIHLVDFFTRLIYIYQLVWDARPTLLYIIIAISIFNGIAPVIVSLISARMIDMLTQSYSGLLLVFGGIFTILFIQFIFTILQSIISRVYDTTLSLSGDVVSNHIRHKLLAKAKEIDLSRYDDPEFYAKMENASREAGSRPLQVVGSVFSTFSRLISMVSFVFILAAVHPIAPLAMILVSLPSTVVTFWFRKKYVRFMVEHSIERRQMSYFSGVIMQKDLIKEVRVYDLEDQFVKKYQAVFQQYFQKTKKLRWQDCLWNLLASLFSLTATFGMYTFLAYGVFTGQFAVGAFTLYTSAVNSITGGVGSLIGATASIYEGTLFIDNLIAFLNETPQIVPITTPPAEVNRTASHTIEFQNVSFQYPGTTRSILKNISFTIHGGKTTALVGLNGAGKTTLVKLMVRLYDPTEGIILLDGRDIREYDLAELYSLYGLIFQDYGKYALSLEEAIFFGDTHTPQDPTRLHTSAVMSNLMPFVHSLPKGFQTPLTRLFDKDGIEPSIGQWQKIAITRAFYRDAEIMILDEPTASLDALAEQEMYQYFDQLRSHKTTVFVSHRLSSAKTADQIIVLKDGEVVEVGSHDVLMQTGGEYKHLFTVQAERYG